VEFAGRSLTYNPAYQVAMNDEKMAFAKHLKKCIASDHASGSGDGSSEDSADGDEDTLVEAAVDGLLGLTGDDDDSSAVTQQEIHSGLKAYYNISLSRFVDVVCQQVIDYFLLHSDKGPLAVLSTTSVMNMTPDQLDAIAGEDMVSRGKREQLEKEIEVLTRAHKVLRA
jgi:hypothetical protein